MPSVRAELVGLERERERVERDLAAAQAPDVTPTGIEVIVHELVAALARLRDVLEAGERRSGRGWCGRSSVASRSTKRRAGPR
jgi:hypothetical protein